MNYQRIRIMICDSINWFGRQEPPVKAAIIVGCITIFTVIIGLIFKDLLIPIFLERRKTRVERKNVFKNYKAPLETSAESLKARLDEIFRTRAHLLWKDNPANDFYNYKFISTGYRLSSLLGWIYAFRKEESYLQVPSKKLHTQIKKELNAFTKSLADGQGVEMDVANRFLLLFKINKKGVEQGVIEKFSVEIDRLVQLAISPEGKELLNEISEEYQNNFLMSLSQLVEKLFGKKIDVTELIELNIVQEASIKLGLIYRDWQNGIGDLMIKYSDKKLGRAYDVISFREYENKINNNDNEYIIWFNRTMRLFKELDVSVDNKFDNRIEQLRKIQKTLSELIDALKKCRV